MPDYEQKFHVNTYDALILWNLPISEKMLTSSILTFDT